MLQCLADPLAPSFLHEFCSIKALLPIGVYNCPIMALIVNPRDFRPQADCEKATAKATHEEELLGLVKGAISSVQDAAATAMKMMTATPPATFHILKAAILLVCGADKESVSTWKQCYPYFGPKLFDAIAAYDAKPDRDMALWKQIRSCYKAVKNAADFKSELPQSCLGALLVTFIKHVRRVAKKAAIQREKESVVAEKTAEKEAKQAELKAVEEAEAVVEAEKAAAEAAAAAAAEKAEAEAKAAAEAAEAAKAEAGDAEAEAPAEGGEPAAEAPAE